MSGDPVLYEAKDAIATVTINRADAMNALNEDVVQGLNAAWTRLMEGDERVAVLRAAGTRAFSAGADLKDPPRELWAGIPGIGVAVDKPIVAAVKGYCVGGAYILVQACDLAVAAESAMFLYPEAQVGFSGGMIAGAAGRLPHKIAMEFMLTGARFDARRAYEVGMVNRVVPDGDEDAAALEYAKALADSAPLVVRTLKRFVNDTVTAKGPSELMGLARRDLLAIQRSADSKEGMAAFAEKRKPKFQGR